MDGKRLPALLLLLLLPMDGTAYRERPERVALLVERVESGYGGRLSSSIKARHEAWHSECGRRVDTDGYVQRERERRRCSMGEKDVDVTVRTRRTEAAAAGGGGDDRRSSTACARCEWKAAGTGVLAKAKRGHKTPRTD